MIRAEPVRPRVDPERVEVRRVEARDLISDGAEVSVGDELVEIETDKATMVYEAEAAGSCRSSRRRDRRLPSAR